MPPKTYRKCCEKQQCQKTSMRAHPEKQEVKSKPMVIWSMRRLELERRKKKWSLRFRQYSYRRHFQGGGTERNSGRDGMDDRPQMIKPPLPPLIVRLQGWWRQLELTQLIAFLVTLSGDALRWSAEVESADSVSADTLWWHRVVLWLHLFCFVHIFLLWPFSFSLTQTGQPSISHDTSAPPNTL